MVKVIVFALVAGVLVAGAHAQTAVKVGGVANVNVGANGQTSVVAPGTDVKVDQKDTKLDAGTPTNVSTTVKGPAPDAKKNANVAVDVNVGGAVKVDVKKTPEKSTTGPAAAAASTTAKPAKPDMPAKMPEKSTTAAKPAPAKPGAVAVSVDTKKAGETTTVKVDKAAGVQVNVKAGSAGTSGTSSTTTVTTPAKTAVATSSSGNTQVNSPGADVTVTKPPGGGQPTTTVYTNAGPPIKVKNNQDGTEVTGIPVIGSVSAPGGRKMLRAW